ncbi:MAG TPA: hypothetical protein VMN35_08265 [Gaiellaceae bacterium]|nr:hypothetical protein [Gaiellaceae bacterium]
MTRHLLICLCLVAATVVALETPAEPGARAATVTALGTGTAVLARSGCKEARPGPAYVRRVQSALRARRDVWGKRLLAAPGGPSYERAQRFLKPLFLARAHNGRRLTDSGVHYTHFSQPAGAQGATSVALHVADGSQIISRRAHGRRLTVAVGSRGRERYGACLRRLRGPELAEGYLPVLETTYVDRHGVRYRQESFAAHVPETRSLVSFVTLTADARRSKVRTVRLRFTPSVSGLERDGSRLRRKGRTYLFFSSGGSFGRPSLKYGVQRGTVRTVYVAWLHTPSRSDDLVLDEERFQKAREALRRYWERRLAHGGTISVSEKRVNDAARNLLIQNMGLTWRYSIGNRYEQLSTPEGMDVARVLAGYGQLPVSRAILRTSLRKRPAIAPTATTRSTNWRMGARLVAFAQYARLSGDHAEIRRATPTLRGYVRRLGRQIGASRNGLLGRERFSSDVSEKVYGLHSQAVVWQGLRSMGQVWAEAGRPELAAECRRLTRKLERGLDRAVRRSQRRTRSGALFVPVRLLDDERPYGSLTLSREGSYWNLVMPYALASGLFPPHGPRAEGILRYLDRHGSRLLGLVRAGAYPLYRPDRRLASGSNPVYGLNVSRFLADNDRPGQLVLSLYGQLAAEMTPGTFVSGESVSISPLGEPYRATYLPPNGASNAAFLETLRLMLVHETTDRKGRPRGLELAFATPRPWLRPGKRIEVRRIPTSFGRLSFTIEASSDSARVTVQVPDRSPLRSLKLRLRLPQGKKVAGVLTDDGRSVGRVLADRETIELPRAPGPLELEVRFR